MFFGRGRFGFESGRLSAGARFGISGFDEFFGFVGVLADSGEEFSGDDFFELRHFGFSLFLERDLSAGVSWVSTTGTSSCDDFVHDLVRSLALVGCSQ